MSRARLDVTSGRASDLACLLSIAPQRIEALAIARLV